jgi:hypothetical protein
MSTKPLGVLPSRLGVPARVGVPPAVSRVEKPLLVGLVVLTVVWIVYRQVRNHAPRAAAPARSGS